jgi:HSP20 family protein
MNRLAPIFFSSRRTPFSVFEDLNKELGNVFFSDLEQRKDPWGVTESHESDKAYLVAIDVPGIKREDLKIDLDDRTLTISAVRKKRFEKGEEFAKYSKTFTLPVEVDSTAIEAHLEDGVLSLLLPKTEKSQKKNIEVKSVGENNGWKSFFDKEPARKDIEIN